MENFDFEVTPTETKRIRAGDRIFEVSTDVPLELHGRMVALMRAWSDVLEQAPGAAVDDHEIYALGAALLGTSEAEIEFIGRAPLMNVIGFLAGQSLGAVGLQILLWTRRSPLPSPSTEPSPSPNSAGARS